MNERDVILKKVREQLQVLRPILLTDRARDYLKLFDEFLREQEYGLALHAVCDCMLEESAPAVEPAIIGIIRALHVDMEIDDSCVADLARKRGLC